MRVSGALALLMVAHLLATASAGWQCQEGRDVAGWDKYHQLPINRRMLKTLTLDECQKTCSGNDFDCTFVVFQRTTGNCWPKYSWGNGPDGANVADSTKIACRKV